MSEDDGYLIRSAQKISNRYQADIQTLHPTQHPTTQGDSRERIWHKFMQGYLPKRFATGKGFVCDSKGNISEQIDLIIYLRNHTICLNGFEGDIVIPVESVLAIFEIKPKVTHNTLRYAQKKADSVEKLIASNIKSENGDVALSANIVTGILADKVGSTKNWKSRTFKNFLERKGISLTMFATIENGCVNIKYGHPVVDKYYCYEDKDALMHALFDLTEALRSLEESRRYQPKNFSPYKELMSSPTEIRLKS